MGRRAPVATGNTDYPASRVKHFRSRTGHRPSAQAAARSFIQELPKNVRLGIVSFAGTAAVVQTPTESRDDMLAAIEELGYRRNFAARILATNRSRRIGMVTAHLALHGPSMIALGVQEAGYEALLTSALKGKGAMAALGGGDYADVELGRAVVYLTGKAGGSLPTCSAQLTPTASTRPATIR